MHIFLIIEKGDSNEIEKCIRFYNHLFLWFMKRTSLFFLTDSNKLSYFHKIIKVIYTYYIINYKQAIFSINQ